MKRALLILAPNELLVLAAWVLIGWFGRGEPEIEFRYAKVEQGELIRSISAPGVVVPLTSVDVKSKAGGTVVRLAVDEGAVVKKGDLIAIIDERDTRAIYDQAQADLRQTQARADQAADNLRLQRASTQTSIEDARASLEIAKSRLQRSELEAKRQPDLTDASIRSAQAAHSSALEELRRYEQVTSPQLRRDAQGNLNRTKADFDAAKADLERQENLLKQGFVAQGTVDRARANFQAASAAYETARQRMSTLDLEVAAQIKTLTASEQRAKASLDEARAGASQVQIAQRNLEEARKSVQLAEIALRKALDARITVEVRKGDVTVAQAQTVRSRVASENAKVQLDSTTVAAPRDGIVTQKYIEEGTIIPPATSAFAQGTSIVQLSDVSRLFVDCNVDEADFSEVRKGQRVRIVTEAFPGVQFEGRVERVNPAATTEQNITFVKVRVEVHGPQSGGRQPGGQGQRTGAQPAPDARQGGGPANAPAMGQGGPGGGRRRATGEPRVLPGFNATCEFLTLSKPGVLLVPSQAIQREDGKTFVRVKTSDPLKPQRREVKVGESGNNGTEVLEGLKEGEEVVVAEINVRELKETQDRIMQALQGGSGGLAGGGPSRMGGRTMTGTSGGGARQGGGR
jgi:HlyD family secretion protein